MKYASKSNPSLAYLYRRFLIRRLVRNLTPGRFLEIGVGRGKIHEDLLTFGFTGLCVDLNPSIIDQNQRSTRTLRERLQFLCVDFFELEQKFDLIIALEVLEHYSNDTACLERWKRLLNYGGSLILSVPAHMDHWTQNDSEAGHARRYERSELLQKVLDAGFRIDAFWCYGFPLLNWSYQISSGLPRKTKCFVGQGRRHNSEDPNEDERYQKNPETGAASFTFDFEKTVRSGERALPGSVSWLWRELLWWPFLQVQRAFFNTDRGIGFLIKCGHRRVN